MAIEMNEAPPLPQWPEGLLVRTLLPGQDERAVFEAEEEAFKDHWGHIPRKFEEWEHWMVKRENFDAGLWFLAYDGDELAGISLCHNENDAGWVDILAVRRPWRHRGLGMALLLHSFGACYKRGTRTVFLGVDSQNLTGATRLYMRAGMHVVSQYDTYQKELRPGIDISTEAITP
jgi:ribosomal protein S18 acetylase RimI-like enzyme